MRVDANFYGTVPMPDAGDPAIAPTDRRYGNDDFIACYENLIHWARTADRVGFNTIWFTEHHFQHEGYEVTPNLVLFSLYVATQTARIKCGQMFNVVPQWHPLKLAEDVAMADILTNGRMDFGVGRGTVPREAQSLGTVVASGDNEMSRELDRINRETFEESMEIILAAWGSERFSFRGKHFILPPDDIPDRGGYVTDLTLVPRPRRRIPVWQPVSSPQTQDYVPRMGFRAVMAATHPERLQANWELYAHKREEYGNPVTRPGQDRMLVINTHVARTHEEAVRRARPGHDEYVKFLSPYGRFSHYRMPDGSAAPFDYRPPVEESIRQKIWAIGSVQEIVDLLGGYRDTLGLEHVCFFFDLPGLRREEIDEQFHLMAEEVFPALGEPMEWWD